MSTNNGSSKSKTAIWVAVIPGVFALCVAIVTVFGPEILDIIFPGPTSTPSTVQIESAVEITPTDTPPFAAPDPETQADLPQIFNFSTCQEPCDESNSSRSFPAGETKLYVQWNYENIPIGADYSRTWTNNSEEWIRYRCAWPGPINGIAAIELTEPKGLRSGTWEMTISINDEILLSEQITLVGSWDYWAPVKEVVNSCY